MKPKNKGVKAEIKETKDNLGSLEKQIKRSEKNLKDLEQENS
jgi:septal ring factor EnvC (AmiA/AmiB activator)